MNGVRSVSEVLQDILRNLQEIVRSEVRLAKVELQSEARRAASALAWLSAGVVGALSAWLFLLWTASYLLATRMPMWAATLIVAGVTACAAGVLIMGGMRRMRKIQPIPERTVESVKESVEWIKQPAR